MTNIDLSGPNNLWLVVLVLLVAVAAVLVRRGGRGRPKTQAQPSGNAAERELRSLAIGRLGDPVSQSALARSRTPLAPSVLRL
jgi:hypothetical protein